MSTVQQAADYLSSVTRYKITTAHLHHDSSDYKEQPCVTFRVPVESFATVNNIYAHLNRIGRTDTFFDHHGEQRTWDFDKNKCVATYDRFDEMLEICVMQFN